MSDLISSHSSRYKRLRFTSICFTIFYCIIIAFWVWMLLFEPVIQAGWPRTPQEITGYLVPCVFPLSLAFSIYKMWQHLRQGRFDRIAFDWTIPLLGLALLLIATMILSICCGPSYFPE